MSDANWLEFFEDRERLYATYYLDFAQQHARRDPEAYEQLEAESRNLLKVADWLGKHEEVEGILRLASALWQDSDFLRSRGFMQRGLSLLEQAREAAGQTGDLEAEFFWLETLAHVHWYTGNPTLAQPLYDKALDLAQTSNKLQLKAQAQLGMGRLQTDMGHLEQANGLLKLALHNYRLIQNYEGEIKSLIALGELLSLQGDFAEAEAYSEYGLLLAQVRQDTQSEMSLRFVLGYVGTNSQDWHKAVINYESATNIARMLGDRFLEVRGLHNMGEAWLGLGNVQQAVALLEEAVDLQEKIDDALTKAFTHLYLAKAYYILEELDKSLIQLQYVYPFHQVPLLAAEAAEASWIKANIHLKQSNSELARTALHEVLNFAPDRMAETHRRAESLLNMIENTAGDMLVNEENIENLER